MPDKLDMVRVTPRAFSAQARLYVAAALCVGASLFALPAAAAPSQAFPNHVPQAVGQSRRLGPLSGAAGMNLAIGLPLRNRPDLGLFLAQVSDPRSPNYRRYLSASEFAARFGPTQADYDKLIGFFQAHGLAVSGTHPNRMILDVAGPVSAIDKTLHVNMTVWEHPTRGRFFAPDRDPSLDVDVAVLDITGLDNFALPKPADLKTTPLTAARPMTTGSGPDGLFFGNDFRAAYAPAVALTGAGQTIGLVEFDGFYAADMTANFQQAGLPPVPVSTVLLDSFSGSPGNNNMEVILDIMMAGFMAPGANIVVYEGYNWNDVLNRMATDNIATQLSCSWTFYPINATTEQIFSEMIAQGQSFFTAAGDGGAYTNGTWPPADDPNVTSVGGTALTTAGPGGAWVAETTWNDGGGGVSTTYAIPSYQQSMNMAAIGGSNTMRNVPDVAMLAAVQIFLICNNGEWVGVGGTSAATPLWAGFMALANQQAIADGKPAVGFLNPAIYGIGSGSDYAGDMHDIVTGSNGFAAVPGYDLATGWGTPAGQSLINDLTSMPRAPSFGLSATPTTVSIAAGFGASASIQVAPRNGFSGSVILSVSGLPSGVTAAFGAIGSSGASHLNLTASSGAAPGTYLLSVQGVSGSLTASVGLTLQVTGMPSFAMAATPTSVNIIQGGVAGAGIAVMPFNGFNSTVSLSVAGLPSGVTASFSPSTTATASALNFVASAGATVGSAMVTVTGTAGSLVVNTSITLTVAPSAPFSIKASASAPGVTQGASATDVITVTPKTGFSGKVTLSATGLPSGVTASFNSASTATTSTLTFAAASSAATGNATVTITGAQGAASASVTLNLTVRAAPGFALGLAPAGLNLTRGTSGTSILTIVALNGFTGAVTLSASGLPAGVTAAWGAASSGVKLTLTANASAAIGPATVTITGKSGSISATAPLELTVAAAPSFTLTSSASNVNVAAGSSGTATITVNPQAGFSGAVALTAASLPTGVTASFSPASASTPGTLTLTATSAAALKTTQFTVKGSSGNLTAALLLTVTVAAPPPPNFSVALAPASLSVVQGAKGATAVSITLASGTMGTITLSASGLPSGVTASFSASSSSSLFLATFTAGSAAVVGSSQVTVKAASGSTSHTAILNLTIAAASAATTLVNLAPFYNVSGSAADSLPFTGGGLDASGRSYSGTLLGASRNVGGTVFSLGPMAAPDAVSGRTVTLPAGKFSTLMLLASGVNGNQTGQTFVVKYTDGSTATFTQNLSDWCSAQNYPGESSAVIMNYRDNSTGTLDVRPLYLYGYSFSLNNAKTVSSIALPQNRNVVVLAITLAR